jgi:hypothetical protein
VNFYINQYSSDFTNLKNNDSREMLSPVAKNSNVMDSLSAAVIDRLNVVSLVDDLCTSSITG